MTRRISCSWCHTLNDESATWCSTCGHRADLPRMQCDCPKCIALVALATPLLVDCDRHGKLRGYIVCIHVLNAKVKTIAHRLDPDDTDDGIGEILCPTCLGADYALHLDNLKLICEQCVRDVIDRVPS